MARILFVMTGSDHWTLADGTKHPTGFWAEEAVIPLEAFTGAGHSVTVATPGGVVPPVDARSQRDARITSVVETAPQFHSPVALGSVTLDDYDAVFVPGGHGPMEDLAGDADAGRILTQSLADGRPIAIVCHGPAALLPAADAFAGYKITCFSNEEEKKGGLADKASWLLETRLREAGLEVQVGKPYAPHIEQDRHVLTGQNPASSAPLAKALLDHLP